MVCIVLLLTTYRLLTNAFMIRTGKEEIYAKEAEREIKWFIQSAKWQLSARGDNVVT